MIFDDRDDAGEKLGKELRNKDVEADLVLAIPRGGLPVGRKVADALDTELDVVVASKIGAPENPELGIGAAASDGSYWINEQMTENLGVNKEFVEEGIERETEKAREKLAFMRGKKELPKLEDKNVLIVDDGIATGGTVIACLRQVKNTGAERIILAVPVAPQDIPEKLKEEADEIVILETPTFFRAVGSHYKDFRQVTDEEARDYLT